jgi:hypothetical protein
VKPEVSRDFDVYMREEASSGTLDGIEALMKVKRLGRGPGT